MSADVKDFCEAATRGPMRQIEHFLPDVGAIEAELHDHSEGLYDFLLRSGEIRRAQQLAQLGAVQHAWPVARHTRWDFTMLLLDLIRRTKSLPGIHIGSRVRLSPALEVSSARDLLSCWALLLNLGHLHGTFATETELLFEINRSSKRRTLRAELIASVPPGSAEEWAREVISQERTYQFYQLLAFYRLRRMASGRRVASIWLTMLDRYVAARPEESDALRRARMLFRRIRRLAFLTLDASLTPSPLEVRLAQLASVPEALERLLAPTARRTADDELSSLEEFLAREIYNGEAALVSLSDTRDDLRRRIRHGLERNGLRYAVETAATTELHDLSHAASDGKSVAVVRGVIGGPYLSVLSLGRRVEIGRRRHEDAFRRWASLMGSRADVHVVQNASGTQLVLQANCQRRSGSDFAAAIAGTVQLTERLRKRLSSTLPFAGLDQMIFEDLSKGIVVAALQHYFPNALHWEWTDGQVPHAAIGSRTEVLARISALRDSPGLSRSRDQELRALYDRASHVRGQILVVATANLIGYGADRVTQIAELDGVVVAVDLRRADLVLTAVEAKYTKGAEKACRIQLERTLQSLGLRSWQRRGRIAAKADGRRGQAWVHIRSSYSRA